MPVSYFFSLLTDHSSFLSSDQSQSFFTRPIMLFSLVWFLPVALAVNIISSNDDGWAEINIRTLYDSLTTAGHSVVISAPAQDQSGTGRPPISFLLQMLILQARWIMTRRNSTGLANSTAVNLEALQPVIMPRSRGSTMSTRTRRLQ